MRACAIAVACHSIITEDAELEQRIVFIADIPQPPMCQHSLSTAYRTSSDVHARDVHDISLTGPQSTTAMKEHRASMCVTLHAAIDVACYIPLKECGRIGVQARPLRSLTHG